MTDVLTLRRVREKMINLMKRSAMPQVELFAHEKLRLLETILNHYFNGSSSKKYNIEIQTTETCVTTYEKTKNEGLVLIINEIQEILKGAVKITEQSVEKTGESHLKIKVSVSFL